MQQLQRALYTLWQLQTDVSDGLRNDVIDSASRRDLVSYARLHPRALADGSCGTIPLGSLKAGKGNHSSIDSGRSLFVPRSVLFPRGSMTARG